MQRIRFSKRVLTLVPMGIACALAPAACNLGDYGGLGEGDLQLRIENATGAQAEVTIRVETVRRTPVAQPGAAQVDEEAPEKSAGPRSAEVQVEVETKDAIVHVPGGRATSGSLACGHRVIVYAVVGEISSTVTKFGGDGSGTPGFDSGSVGTTGERYLLHAVDYACGDTIVVQLDSAENGRVTVVSPGESLPQTILDPGAEPGDDGEPDGPTGASPTVTFRVENATATAGDVTITRSGAAGGSGQDISTPVDVEVRVPPGSFSLGEITCAELFTVRAEMTNASSSAVLLTGDGTGTAGFDGASIGFDGERLLAFGDHYTCGQSIVVRITDDGSGIGTSASETPLGLVNVFRGTNELPDPDLPDPDELDGDETEEVARTTFEIVNLTESTVQVNVAAGNGSLATSGGQDVTDEFDVRVPPFTASRGTRPCAREYMIAAAHLESTSSTFSEGGGTIFSGGGGVNYHGVVLLGDGTGTEGFDENSIPVVRGRLLELSTHYECGDTLIVTIEETNNKVRYDEEGNMVTDDFGNPELEYGVGVGAIEVRPD
jgi:hypothetical protein